MDAALIAAVVAALAFAWTNGFHDAGNSVATSLATGALTPRVALALAALLNAVGGLLGVSVAEALSSGVLAVPVDVPGVGLVLAALVAAVGWNLLTWWYGLPSSSTHALFGGLAGAGLVAGAGVDWGLLDRLVLLPLVASPVIGLVLAWLLTVVLLRLLRDRPHAETRRRFRIAQTVSASAMALGHGLQDAQKTAAVVVLALVAHGDARAGAGVPVWVRLAVALALGAGTACGGWRIIATLGRRVAPLDPVGGFTAEVVAAASLYAAAGFFAAPVSSTHVLVASIVGTGATTSPRAVRWRQVGRIGVTFLLTPLVTGLVAAGVMAATRL